MNVSLYVMPASEPEDHSGEEWLRLQLLPPESAVIVVVTRQEGHRHDVSRAVSVTWRDRHRVPAQTACVVHKSSCDMPPVLTAHVCVTCSPLGIMSTVDEI